MWLPSLTFRSPVFLTVSLARSSRRRPDGAAARSHRREY